MYSLPTFGPTIYPISTSDGSSFFKIFISSLFIFNIGVNSNQYICPEPNSEFQHYQNVLIFKSDKFGDLLKLFNHYTPLKSIPKFSFVFKNKNKELMIRIIEKKMQLSYLKNLKSLDINFIWFV